MNTDTTSQLPDSIIKAAGQVVLINLLIGLFVTMINLGKGLMDNLLFSQLIGLSTFAWVRLILFFDKKKPLPFKKLLLTLAIIFGALQGLALGCWAVGYDTLEFFQANRVFILKILIFSLVAGTVVSNFFISRWNLVNAHQQAQEEKIRRLDMEKEILQAELKTLQAQIEPHFLFNTLSNIQSLLRSDQNRAEKMLLMLTDFLRATLKRTRQSMIPLGEEIRIVTAYLKIQQMRMGERLEVSVQLDPRITKIPIPPLLIQPLVENCVRHGIEPQPGHGSITLDGSLHDQTIRIRVMDNGVGFTNCHTDGMGLNNIRNRLRLVYGQSGRLILNENSPHGVIALLEFPCEPIR